jgi:hypothetical protein
MTGQHQNLKLIKGGDRSFLDKDHLIPLPECEVFLDGKAIIDKEDQH